jgi:hypothetical protein
MRKILQKLAWKTNRWDVKFSLLNIYLGGDNGKFGFEFIKIDNGFQWEGSLLEITWEFPTVTHRGELNIDVLFLYNKWDKWCRDNDDRELWGSQLNSWEKFNCKVNNWLNNIG